MPVHDVSHQFATPILGIATQYVCVCVGGPMVGLLRNQSMLILPHIGHIHEHKSAIAMGHEIPHAESCPIFVDAVAARANGKLKTEQFDYVIPRDGQTTAAAAGAAAQGRGWGWRCMTCSVTKLNHLCISAYPCMAT